MPLRNPAKTPRLPRILLIPPPELPVPAVQGGAVETLVTHLIRENERAGKLDLLCASIPDPAARAQAEDFVHTKMLYIPRPKGTRRYWPMVFVERCLGIAAPYDPWYQKVQLSLALELPPPDLIVAEGGTLTQCSAISRMFGRKRCLAHLHGQTSCSRQMDEIYGGILALSQFIRDDYLKTAHWTAKTPTFCPTASTPICSPPVPPTPRCAPRWGLRRRTLSCFSVAGWNPTRASTSCWRLWPG